MINIDRFLAILALLLFAAFSLVLVFFVPDIDLAVVIIFVLVLAAFDFWRSLFRRSRAR